MLNHALSLGETVWVEAQCYPHRRWSSVGHAPEQYRCHAVRPVG